ncbi:hypothetical protein FI667_g8803, partial [Globisporangium splendens]
MHIAKPPLVSHLVRASSDNQRKHERDVRPDEDKPHPHGGLATSSSYAAHHRHTGSDRVSIFLKPQSFPLHSLLALRQELNARRELSERTPLVSLRAMKFPLPADVFPDVNLSLERRAEFTRLAHALLDQALEGYALFNCEKRELKSHWKSIKSCENVTVYKEKNSLRTSTSPATIAGNEIPSSRSNNTATPRSQSSRSDVSSTTTSLGLTAGGVNASLSDRTMPQLLAVGTVVGTMEDMMFGMASPNRAQAIMKDFYTQGEIVDTRMLYEIKGPTPDDPLRFLGLKWLVKGHTDGIGTLVRPRDLVYLENTGIKTHADGTRTGYIIMHSVDLDECRDLEAEKDIVRGRISSCYLFQQLPNGVVSVYLKSCVDPNGNIAESIAVTTTAKSLIGFGRATICAHHKKIAWELHKKRYHITSSASPTHETTAFALNRSINTSACSVCEKSFSSFRTTCSCQLCGALVCSKCRAERKLVVATLHGSSKNQVVDEESVDLCRSCIARCTRVRAEDVAREEILSGHYGSIPKPKKSTRRDHHTVSVSETVSSTMSADDLSDLVDQFASTSYKTQETSRPSTLEDVCTNDDGDGEEVMELDYPNKQKTYSNASDTSSDSHSPPQASSLPVYNKHNLYQRIAQLNQTAESVYQYAKQTGVLMGSSSMLASAGLSYQSTPSDLSHTFAVEDELD